MNNSNFLLPPPYNYGNFQDDFYYNLFCSNLFVYEPKKVIHSWQKRFLFLQKRDFPSKFIKRRELYESSPSGLTLFEGPRYLDSSEWLVPFFGEAKPYIYYKRYRNGLVKVGFSPNSIPVPPPTVGGPRSTLGLTKYARRQLLDATAYLTTIKQKLSFITLTYSTESLPTHDVSKRQLSNFFKRLKYHSHEPFVYCWVAEIQPKRLRKTGISAIHYHILTPTYFDADFIRLHWNSVTSADNNHVNLKCVNYPAHYISKYVAKGSHLHGGEHQDIHWIGGDRYGLSHEVSKALKPIEEIRDYNKTYFDYLDNGVSHCNAFNGVTNTDYTHTIKYPKKLPLQNLLE